MSYRFTEDDYKYINADIFDKSQEIYVYGIYNTNLINTYTIHCNLVQGKYCVGDKRLNLHFNSVWELTHSTKYYAIMHDDNIFRLTVNEPCEVLLKIKFCSKRNIERIVHILREQVIYRKEELAAEQKRLIAKSIKSSTNLGEDYNHQSFIDTINECIENDETIEIDETKTNLNDFDTRYLLIMKNEQDRIRLNRKKQALEKEEQKISSFNITL